jgi:hypothetical protein
LPPNDFGPIAIFDHRLSADNGVTRGDHELLRGQRVRDSLAARDELATTCCLSRHIQGGTVAQSHAAVQVAALLVGADRHKRVLGAHNRDGGLRPVASGAGVDESPAV